MKITIESELCPILFAKQLTQNNADDVFLFLKTLLDQYVNFAGLDNSFFDGILPTEEPEELEEYNVLADLADFNADEKNNEFREQNYFKNL